jgi:hypothetical protein
VFAATFTDNLASFSCRPQAGQSTRTSKVSKKPAQLKREEKERKGKKRRALEKRGTKLE